MNPNDILDPNGVLKAYATYYFTAYCLSKALKEELTPLIAKLENKDEKEIISRIDSRVQEISLQLKSEINALNKPK